MVPEARGYFDFLEMGEQLLAGVEELCMDGGNQVYQEGLPIISLPLRRAACAASVCSRS